MNHRDPAPLVKAGVFTVLLLCLINLLNYIDRNIVSGILELIGRDLLNDSYDAKSIHFYKGVIHYSMVATYILFAPIISYFIDARGWKRKYVIIPGIFLWCIFTGLGGCSSTYETLLITRSLVGIGEACFVATAPGLIADYFPIEKRGRILMWFYLAGPLGLALSYMLAPNIAALFDNNWRYAFFLVGFPGLVLGILFFFIKEPQKGASHESVRRQHSSAPLLLQKEDLKDLLKNKSYIFVTLGMTALTFTIWGIAFFLPQYFYDSFHEAYGYTLAQTGTTIGIMMLIGGFVGILLGGFLSDYIHKRNPGGYFQVSGISLLLCAPILIVVFTTTSPTVFLILTLVCIILMMMNQAPSHAIILNVTIPPIRTTAFAFNMLIIHLFGDMISPPILGGTSWFSQSLFDAPPVTGMLIGFILSALVLGIGGFFFLKGSPHYKRDIQAVEERLDGLIDKK